MKESTIERNNEILAYANSHSIEETADYFDLSVGYIDRIVRYTERNERKYRKHRDLINTLKQVAENYTFPELYDIYGKDFQRGTFYCLLNNNNIKYKRVDRKAFFIGRHSYNHVCIDDEHLKANAHKYTCLQYYKTFKPNCTRSTLYNRAKELGVSFIGKDESVVNRRIQRNEDFIIEKAREEASLGHLNKSEFFEKYNIGEYMSFGSFTTLMSRERIRFAKKFPNSFTADEIAIIKEYYPKMGQKCLELLPPGRSFYALRKYCYENKIKYVKVNPLGGVGHACRDHKGNLFSSYSSMCKFWGISYTCYKERLNRGWDKERALTTPTDNKRRNYRGKTA